ncbi:DUF4239 domain-containing protein [Kitasatospora sp. NPDC048540]|uniref:bestrophin-like domain n=1 Tax=Kitasatospora sp. NPDC048540 TaxID=3155634 RepID=UPI0033D6B9DF
MEVWLLNHLPTFALTAAVVGGIIIFAMLGDLLCRHWFPSTTEGTHNDMVGVVLSLFGAIYGVILAFVIVNLWTQLQSAETIVATEATATAQIVRDANAFPPEVRDKVDAAVGDYVHAVVERQWPLMREGRSDYGRTAPEVAALYQALQSYTPTDVPQQTFQQHAITSLDQVVAQRRARITQSGQQLPTLLQVLVFGGALVILPLTFLYGREDRRIEIIFVGAVSSLIGFSLLLVLVLDRPFSGDLSVSPQPFMDGVLAQFWLKP